MQMEQNDQKLSFEADQLNVFVVTPASKFKAEWVFLFRKYLSAVGKTLTPAQKAVLFDVFALGSVSPQGLICAPTSVLLLNGVSRTTVYKTLEVLRELGLIAGPTKGMVYLSPKLLYRGPARDWGMAVHYWRLLGGKDEE
jgi:hypothetical protein